MRFASGTSVPGAPQRPSVRSQHECVDPDQAKTVHCSGSDSLTAIAAHTETQQHQARKKAQQHLARLWAKERFPRHRELALGSAQTDAEKVPLALQTATKRMGLPSLYMRLEGFLAIYAGDR